MTWRRINITYEIESHDLSHRVSQEDREDVVGDLEEWPKKIALRPSRAISSVIVLRGNVKFATAIDPRVASVETWEAWAAAMQAYSAMFEIGTREIGDEVQFMLHHVQYTVEATGRTSHINVERWLDAFFLAMICRDEKRVRYLCGIPVETLREYGESKGTVYAPYVYRWASALQAVVMHRDGFEEDLAAALEQSDPEVSGVGDDEYVGRLVLPEMIALLRLVERDSAAFNEALAEGLVAFRDYWTATDERANDINGVFPLGLLAFACMAHDISQVDPNFELDVVSGYLPKHLVEHSWHDEFAI